MAEVTIQVRGTEALREAFREATARLADLLLPRGDVSEERLHNALLVGTALTIPWGTVSDPPVDEQSHRDLLSVLDECTPQEADEARKALRRTLVLDNHYWMAGGHGVAIIGGLTLRSFAALGPTVPDVPLLWDGRFDGSSPARCLFGHIARARGTVYQALTHPRPDVFRPIELWVLHIRPGMDDEARRRAALLDTWLTDWLDARTIGLPSRAEVRDA